MVAKKPHPRFAEEVHHMVCLVQIGQLSNCCSFCNRHPHFFEKKLAYQQIIKTPQLKVGIRYLNIFKNSISCIYGICQWKLPPLGCRAGPSETAPFRCAVPHRQRFGRCSASGAPVASWMLLRRRPRPRTPPRSWRRVFGER